MEEHWAYVALSADYLHAGHINILNEARKRGKVLLGLLTDNAIANHKRIPSTTYQQRLAVAQSIAGVEKVIPQATFSYRDVLLAHKPKYVVHGDDWKLGTGRGVRAEVIELLEQWGGELIELPYTEGLSSSYIHETLSNGVTATQRLQSLRRLIEHKDIVRVLEVHNGLTGLIVENTHLEDGDRIKEFDCMWESSLTDSTSKGKPDTQAVDNSSRVDTIQQILEVTTKPMIVDGDNGGLIEHFRFFVRTLERLGVSAVIIEDKTGPKRNSLFGVEVDQYQDSMEAFSEKIRQGKAAQVTPDFMIIARIESLILESGMEDALARAEAYIEAGADGIMIHSRSDSPAEILEFASKYHKLPHRVPLVSVPTAYASVSEQQLYEAGFKIVIYANQLIRSAFPAMVSVAESILQHERCEESNKICMPFKTIINMIPET